MSSWWDPRVLFAKASDKLDTLENKAYRNKKLQMQWESVGLQLAAGTGAVVGAVALFFGITKSNFSLVMVSVSSDLSLLQYVPCGRELCSGC